MNLFINEVSGVPQFLTSDALTTTSDKIITSEQLNSQLGELIREESQKQFKKDGYFRNDPKKIYKNVLERSDIEKSKKFLDIVNDPLTIGLNDKIRGKIKIVFYVIFFNYL